MPAILIIVTSADTLPNGDKTGLWLEEFAVPYLAFRKAGYPIVAASPKGGVTPVDPRSLGAAENHPQWQQTREVLKKTVGLGELQAEDFSAVFLSGGHGVMFDFPHHPELGRLLAGFHAQGKPLAAVCHGPAGFVGVARADGRPLVEGYKLTAFSDIEEKLLGLDAAMPFLLSARLRELGAKVRNSVPVLAHVRQDRQLITGQNPKSSKKVADLLVSQLDKT